MRILQITASYKPAYIYGGPTMSVSKLCEHLINAGCHVEVYTTTANGQAELEVVPGASSIVDGVAVTYFNRITKDHSHFSPALLARLWTNVKKFDIVHVHAWWNLVSVLSALIAVLRKVPLVISPRGTLSGYSFNNKNSLIKKLIHNLLGKYVLDSAFVHATSDAERKALEAIIRPKQFYTIANFVNLAPVVDIKPDDEKCILKLLFFSRIEEKKGLDLLLHALPLLKVPYSLTIAGDGGSHYIESLKHISANNQTNQHINWIGFQSDGKFDVLSEHDLFVLPSYDENFGNAVIESLSAGTAVLISRQVGLSDYVAAHQLGWICETDISSIGDTINKIAVSHKDSLSRISRDAPLQIGNDFNGHILEHKYTNMYQEIINNDSV